MPRRREAFSQRDAQDLTRAFFQLPRNVQITLMILAVIAGILFLFLKSRSTAPHSPGSTAPGEVSDSLAENLFLGNPSDATSNFLNRDNYLIDKTYYVLSYSDSTGDANWVSWRLTRADLGNAPRKPEFDPDESLPATFKRITTHDYVGSGFDRGHLCPHADRAASPVESDSTFCMTNIVPQSHLINEGLWGQEEDYLRQLVRGGHRLYIIAGPAGRGGDGGRGTRATIASGKVTVPATIWKIAVVTDETDGADNLAALTPHSRVIAVDMPNDSGEAHGSWTRFRTTPAKIEQETHLHFFTALPPETRDGFEQQLDQQPVD